MEPVSAPRDLKPPFVPSTNGDGVAVIVAFSFAWAGARSVCVAVFFNDWSPAAPRGRRATWTAREAREPPLVKTLVRLTEVKPALWCCDVSLQPGWCEYLFLVDGVWMLDPNAGKKCPDGAGDFNSARWIEAAAHPASILLQPPPVGI
jgi:hypothetical protein